MSDRLGQDCQRWLSVYETQKSSLLHHSKNITMEDYEATFQKMNKKIVIERHLAFADDFKELLEIAGDNFYIENNHHLLLFQVLFHRIKQDLDAGKQPFVLSEIPTGCGKSWVLAILAAVIRKQFECNVLIATSSNFLAKFGEENYGIQGELT